MFDEHGSVPIIPHGVCTWFCQVMSTLSTGAIGSRFGADSTSLAKCKNGLYADKPDILQHYQSKEATISVSPWTPTSKSGSKYTLERGKPPRLQQIGDNILPASRIYQYCIAGIKLHQ